MEEIQQPAANPDSLSKDQGYSSQKQPKPPSSEQQPYPGQQQPYPGEQQQYMGTAQEHHLDQRQQQQYMGTTQTLPLDQGQHQPYSYPGQQQPYSYPGQQQPYLYPGQQQPYSYPGQQQQYWYPEQQPPVDPRSIVVFTQPSTAQNVFSYLGFAIFTCLCCCWPIGIAAIVFATRVNAENRRGNFDAAKKNSRIALGCSVAALVIGSALLITVISLAATGNLISTTTYSNY